MIASLDILIYTILGLVPGFLIDSILRLNIPAKKREATFAVYRFIILSCLNYAIWIWKIPYIYENIKAIPLQSILIWGLVILFLSPVILGLIIIKSAKWEPVQKALEFLGWKITDSIPSAWDFKFFQKEKCFVIITLTDGEIIYGKFGDQSFASDYEEQDIYIEKLYTYDPDSKNPAWIEVQNSDGILISKGKIKYIEFIK